ncbi:hypothetical protein [Rhodococcoides kroppenstedtii]|uniref:hypothetical protein n=1 Tax=Rhodococcoides kroppenstedtii TaxID=293050 RepID=UPI003633D7E7
MAHSEDLHPDDGADDWFTVADTAPAVEPAAGESGRRLSLAARPLDAEVVDNTDDAEDWFAARDTAAPAGGPVDEFGTRTDTLRAHADHAAPAAGASWWRRHRGSVAVAAALTAVVGVVGGAALVLTGIGEPEPATAAPLLPTSTVDTTTTVAPAEPATGEVAAADVTWCAGQAPGEPVTGDTIDPGMAAIWRFEKAFYFDRDPVAARAAATPDAVMASADRLRVGIDALEPSVEFCVLADPVSPGVYDVTVAERGPGIDPRTTTQRFTTAESGGTTSITAITRR